MILYVSKHVSEGTIESGSAYWYLTGSEERIIYGLWHLVEDGKSKCIHGYNKEDEFIHGGNKFIWYGQESNCSYDTGYGVRGEGWAETESLYVKGEDAAVSFYYYRDVLLNYLQVYDITEVQVLRGSDYYRPETIWHKDSRNPSEKQWVWSGWISLSKYAGKYIKVRFFFNNIFSSGQKNLGLAIDDLQFRGVRWHQDTSEITLDWGVLFRYILYIVRAILNIRL